MEKFNTISFPSFLRLGTGLSTTERGPSMGQRPGDGGRGSGSEFRGKWGH